MIIVVLCIVILCMRRSHRKRDDKVTYSTGKLSTDVTVDCSQSCDVFNSNIVDHLYSTIEPGDSDVPITTNPSYNVHTKPYSKTSEDEYNYVQPNEHMQHSDFDDTIKMDTNPSYGVSIEGDRGTTFSVTATNSDTKADQLIHDTTVKQYLTSVDQSCDAKTSNSPYLTLITNSADLTGDYVIDHL